jgi:hypothetical protein
MSSFKVSVQMLFCAMYFGYLRLNCVDVVPNPSACGPLSASAFEFPQPPPNGDCNSMGPVIQQNYRYRYRYRYCYCYCYRWVFNLAPACGAWYMVHGAFQQTQGHFLPVSREIVLRLYSTEEYFTQVAISSTDGEICNDESKNNRIGPSYMRDCQLVNLENSFTEGQSEPGQLTSTC